MRHPAPPLSEMPGMWRRTLITHADGTRDAATQVRWLQGPTLFVDLRQGAALPDFLHLRGLNDLSFEDCAALAGQEGFAGRLDFDGDCFTWTRLIDFQPRAGTDAGRLWWEEDVLIEAGRDVPYIERWMRDPAVVTRPQAGLRLRDTQTGVAALLVQVGTVFMFARDRAVALPEGQSLAECVAGASSVAEARALLDCEITLGSGGFGSAAVMLASTHPWRVAERFELPGADARWEVIEAEGDPGAVWPGIFSG
ncbi:MAG: hypothetical protein WA825_02220 [Steroidobacteraceae bacterium]